MYVNYILKLLLKDLGVRQRALSYLFTQNPLCKRLRMNITRLFTSLHAGSTNHNIASRKTEVFLASVMYS